MTSEKPVESRERWGWLRVALVVALVVVIVAAIVAEKSGCQPAVAAAIELLSNGLGLVIAVLGVPALWGLRHARSADELFATASISAVVILLGATLLGSHSWGAPVGAGLALVALAISRHRRDGSSARAAESGAKSSD